MVAQLITHTLPDPSHGAVRSTISKIDVWSFREPIMKPVRTSFGVMRDRRCVFVRLEDTDGCFGFGEVFANWPSAAPEHRVSLIAEDLAWRILGLEISDPGKFFLDLNKKVYPIALQSGEFGPFNQSISGIDVAIWDLFSRKAGKSLAKYLNANALVQVPVYASGIHIDRAEEEITKARCNNFNRFKIKVGFSQQPEIIKVNELSALNTPDETIMVDANQAWTPYYAEIFAKETIQAGLAWIEEPISADIGNDRWRKLGTSIKTPLAAGENIVGFDSFASVIASKHLSFIQPDVAKWGGISGCVSVARLAEDNGVKYCPHFLGGGIGLTASAHALAAAGTGWLEVDTNESELRSAFNSVFDKDKSCGSWSIKEACGLGIETLPKTILPYLTAHKEIVV